MHSRYTVRSIHHTVVHSTYLRYTVHYNKFSNTHFQDILIIGLSTSGLLTIDLLNIGLLTIGLSTTGLSTTGLSTTGLLTSSLSTTGRV